MISMERGNIGLLQWLSNIQIKFYKTAPLTISYLVSLSIFLFLYLLLTCQMMKLLWLFCFGLLSLSAADQTFQLNSSFRSDKGKNIVFGAFVPGSSHVNWVLRFLDELTLRGHNVTFVTVVRVVEDGFLFKWKSWANLRGVLEWKP